VVIGDSPKGHEAVATQGNLGEVRLQMRWLAPVIIVLLGLVLAFPTVIFGFPVRLDGNNNDSLIHLSWQTHFSRQFWNGEFYPRWLMDMNGGWGSPSHFFYAPLPHLLASLLPPIFVDDVFARWQLGAASIVALIGSGLTCYSWLRCRFPPRFALLGASVYMAMPYHLNVSLYAVSSFNEFWSFVWLPLVLLFTEMPARWPTRIAGISVSYALLVLTHLLITLIFSPLVLLYAGYLSLRQREHSSFFQALVGMGLGMLLAAIYVLPAMTGQDNVRMYEFLVLQNPWRSAMLFTGMNWKMSLLVFNYVVVATLAFFVCRRGDGENRTWAWFWAAIFGAVFIMMTPASIPIWHVITPLQWLQFPNRFLVIGTLACSAIVTAAADALVRFDRTRRLAVTMFAAVVGLTWIPPYWSSIGKAYCCSQESLVEVMRSGWEEPEYIPRWVHAPKLVPLADGRIGFAENVGPDGPYWAPGGERSEPGKPGEAHSATNEKLRVLSGGAKIELKRWEPRDIAIAVSAAQASTIEVGQFYYPNWTASVAGGERLLPITPSEPAGLITVSLPPGEYVVDVVLERDWAEFLGLLVSASAAVVVMLMLVLSLRRPAADRRRTARDVIEERSRVKRGVLCSVWPQRRT
jgi:hypothetical protein